MTDQGDNNSPPNSYPTGRRSSFAGQTFADLFNAGRSRASEPNNSPPSQFGGNITSAAAQAGRRRLSVSTLGIPPSPNQTSPFGSLRARNDSVSSSNAASIDESAVEDEPASAGQSQPNTPFARRVSFGARALRDMNKPANTGGGGGGTAGSNGDGFNWADNMRTRAERTSVSGANTSPNFHSRAKSVAVMEQQPVRETPKPANVPDHFQERILKGDFYMD